MPITYNLIKNIKTDLIKCLTCIDDTIGIKTLSLTSTSSLDTFITEYDGSFARTGEINVFDFEAVLQTGIPEDTAAFYGGRRVNSLTLQNNTLTMWDVSNITCVDNGDEWFKITFDAVGSWMVGYTAAEAFPEITTNGIYKTKIFTLSSEGKIYSISGTTDNGYDTVTRIELKSGTANTVELYNYQKDSGNKCAIGLLETGGNNGKYIYARKAQMEHVSWQTNQNPSAYIPTTSTAVTEFYDTENGNTVDPVTHIVTEAEGDELENVIGMAFWPSTTNVIGATVFRDFTHADWNKVNGSITAGDVVLIDGTTVADKNTFTASAANATIILNPYVSASGVHAGGIFIKRKTGTGVIEVTIDGGTTWVDVTTQVAGDADWHLCETTLPTVIDPEFGIRLVGSGDAVYLDWAQMDDGYPRVCSHPIGGGETLGAQSLIAADAAHDDKLIKDKQGYVIAEAMLMPDDLAIAKGHVVSVATASWVLYSDTNSDIVRAFDGTVVSSLVGGFDNYSKLASYWGHEVNKKQISTNGLSGSIANYGGSWNITGGIYLGAKVNNTGQFNGIISKVTFGAGIKTTQDEMEEATTQDCYVPINNERVVDEYGEYVYDENGECIYARRG